MWLAPSFDGDDLALQKLLDDEYYKPENRALRIHEALREVCYVRNVVLHCHNQLHEAVHEQLGRLQCFGPSLLDNRWWQCARDDRRIICEEDKSQLPWDWDL